MLPHVGPRHPEPVSWALSPSALPLLHNRPSVVPLYGNMWVLLWHASWQYSIAIAFHYWAFVYSFIMQNFNFYWILTSSVLGKFIVTAGILIFLAVYVVEFDAETAFWFLIVTAMYRYEAVLRAVLTVYVSQIALMGDHFFDLQEAVFERGEICDDKWNRPNLVIWYKMSFLTACVE